MMDKSEVINLVSGIALSFLNAKAVPPQQDGFTSVYDDGNETMFVMPSREALISGVYMKTATVRSIFKGYPNDGVKVEGKYIVNCQNRKYAIDYVEKRNKAGELLDSQHATFRTWYDADDKALANMIDFVCKV